MMTENEIIEDLDLDVYDASFLSGVQEKVNAYGSSIIALNQVVDTEKFIGSVSVEPKLESQFQSIVDLNLANSFSSKIEVAEEVYLEDNMDLIVNKIAAALNTVASVQVKNSKFVEPSEVEEVKNILAEVECSNETKSEFEKELTNFQNKIKTEYTQHLKECEQAKLDYEDKLEQFEILKKELVMNRLSQMIWPYNAKTRAYDKKISLLKFKIEKCKQKIEEAMAMRPAAKEKDLIIFQMHLKNKFETNNM